MKAEQPIRLARQIARPHWMALALVSLAVCGGCWAPVHYYGIPACALPDEFRTPVRGGPELNLSSLAIPPNADYILGPNDVVEVVIQGLFPTSTDIRPMRAQIMANGEIQLPLVGSIKIGGMNLMKAHEAINKAYANGYIKDPRTNVYLVEKASINVVVLGSVKLPGVYPLPKYENDVAHALASAGGLDENAGRYIEVHRRVPLDQAGNGDPALMEKLRAAEGGANIAKVEVAGPVVEEVLPPDPKRIIRIPLRGFGPDPISAQDIVLNPGDVVMVPSREDDVFFVVGKLSPTNFIRFTTGPEERDLGNGFILPRDRDIDVVTAVAMAGYIDPIDSPTTVSVQRPGPDGQPMIIIVDLIKARYDRRETVLVQAGDIIYLNPDFCWWGRRTFDRIIPSLFAISYSRLLRPINVATSVNTGP